MMIQQQAKLRSAKWSEIDHRFGAAQLPKDQSDQTDPKESGQCLHAPEWVAQPSHSWPLLSITAQQTKTMISSDKPIESKWKGRLRNSLRSAVR
jgi:hypothetical protein